MANFHLQLCYMFLFSSKNLVQSSFLLITKEHKYICVLTVDLFCIDTRLGNMIGKKTGISSAADNIDVDVNS